MSTPDQKTGTTDPTGLSARDPWPVLETLLANLGETPSTNHAVVAAVEAARGAVGGEIGYWYSKGINKVSGMSAKRPFPTEQAASLAKMLLAKLPDGADSLVWVNPDPLAAEKQPQTAVIASDARTQGCIVVTTLNPAHRFADGHTKPVRMALKMLLAQRAQSQSQTKTLLNGLIQCLSTIVDAKDPYTVGHCERVARIAVLLVKQMGLGAAMEGDAHTAGLLHDIGKIALSDAVLHRPKLLSAADLSEIREHPVIGERIVASIKPFERLKPAVRHHHEHFSGRGYPDGLAGEAIPLLARVLAVADACDAMMSTRRYRSARSPFEIDAVFTAEAGQQFDPAVVKAFMAVRHEIYPPIYQKGIGEWAFPPVEYLDENLTDSKLLTASR